MWFEIDPVNEVWNLIEVLKRKKYGLHHLRFLNRLTLFFMQCSSALSKWYELINLLNEVDTQNGFSDNKYGAVNYCDYSNCGFKFRLTSKLNRFRGLEVDGSSSKENLFGQFTLLIKAMHIGFL